VSEISDVPCLIQDATVLLGYDCFALVQHVDLASPQDGVVAMSTYEADWVGRIIDRRYFRFDPIHAASKRTRSPFGWQAIHELIEVTQRQQRVLDQACRFGLVDGMTVPLRQPGERLATCTFASRQRKIIGPDQIAMAHVIATFGYEAALRLTRSSQLVDVSPSLTSRQLDCLALAAAGKSEWEISRILHISKSTVHFHMLSAMRRYGVYKRTELIYRALRDGLISYSDVWDE
jgi:DNA-binding CsgD family transcriptional regulator